MLLLCIALGYFLLFNAHSRIQPILNLLLIITQAAISGILAWQVLFMGYGNYIEALPINIWGIPLNLQIDPLSALFILIINFTMITGAIYSNEYMKMYIHKGRMEKGLHYFSFNLLHLSMLLVCMLQHSISFLVAWELMSISSFFLVIFESEKQVNLKAGINYLVQMHIGVFFLIIGFIIMQSTTGSYDFEAFTTYFKNFNNIGLFLLFFGGFGLKAGFVPLHTWLPDAHPATPSHISGIMSGIMIKMGIYGILRVLLHVQSELLEIGLIILVVSIFTGLFGIATAITQRNVKRLLAFSSIENIGIIGIAIGTGVIGLSIKQYPVAILGFTAALLHVFNHSLFKSLLFFTAGSVYRMTHTKDIENMGGLIKKMPQTAALFLIAAISICALPPFNGFVSEFLLYNGLISALTTGPFDVKVIFIFAILALVLIGGLALFCFTKAFGTIFLGTPRHIHHYDEIKEVKWYSLAPLYAITAAILCIGLFPSYFTKPFEITAHQFTGKLSTCPITAYESIHNIGIYSMTFISIIVIVAILRYLITSRAPKEKHITWGCAYNGDASKMQYTGTSFSENFTNIAGNIVKEHEKYTPVEANDIFPKDRHYAKFKEDIFEKGFYEKYLKQAVRLLQRVGFIQTGYMQHYILYAFLLLIVLLLLTVINVI